VLEGPILVASRVDPGTALLLCEDHPSARHLPDGGLVVLGSLPAGPEPAEDLLVLTAGTSDLGVAAECCGVLDALGRSHVVLVDVGVAGLHRLLAQLDVLRRARVIVVIAGMEAALASVVAGLVAAPVIAVPTSVGYGAAQQGMTAMLGLLTSCAPGIAVVNIDNGLGAALVARRILEGRFVGT
jgi:pyridinium-3,5-biscarboxylic acid mononucleotide synthase